MLPLIRARAEPRFTPLPPMRGKHGERQNRHAQKPVRTQTSGLWPETNKTRLWPSVVLEASSASSSGQDVLSGICFNSCIEMLMRDSCCCAWVLSLSWETGRRATLPSMLVASLTHSLIMQTWWRVTSGIRRVSGRAEIMNRSVFVTESTLQNIYIRFIY